MKKILLFASVLLLLAGCEKESGGNGPVVGTRTYTYFTRSFVMVYEHVKSLDLTSAPDSEKYLEMLLTYRNDDVRFTFEDTDAADKARYDELCRSIGDMSFNDSVRRLEGCGFDEHTFPINRWTKIDLVSDRDFDAAHPAGTSLADVLWVETVTPLPFIRSGYKDKYDASGGFEPSDPMNSFDFRTGYFHPLRGRASELGADDLSLLGNGTNGFLAYLTLRLLPEEKRVKHTLTLTLTDTEGETFTATTQVRYY